MRHLLQETFLNVLLKQNFMSRPHPAEKVHLIRPTNQNYQYLATQLRLYWQKEYCALLQWTPPRRSMKEDVERVCDNESQRNQWPLAVVT